MLKTSLLLSVLTAMLGVEGSPRSMERTSQNKVQETSLDITTELTDNQRIEAEARQNLGHSLIEE
ncbi:MAG: hypothetical protein KGQ51_15710 [Planctomycetes bacterium]|nr:hypothetical protein [Planctomycetota bacterium]